MRPDDEDFALRTGRSRRERLAPRGFTARVRQAAFRQGPGAGKSAGRYNRTGVGRAAARAQALAQGLRPGARRVIVKARVARPTQGAASAVHLRYLQRDGVTPDGGRGRLYGPVEDQADARTFLRRGEGDPHQFRFIVAPEDAAELADLRAFTRDLMAQVERDLGVPLDWVAVDHFNTGHPHSHVVLRGRDGRGEPLFIAGDYIAHGMRGRASELATLELGPETQRDVQRRRLAEIDQHRLTGLDRRMLREAAEGLDPSQGRSLQDRALRAGRLATLERMGLAAREAGTGAWTLRRDAEDLLRRLGEREEMLKVLGAALGARGGVSPEALTWHDRAPAYEVTGRLLGRRLADELGDQLAVIVEGFDGRFHHLAVAGAADEIEQVPVGALVALGPPAPGPADRTIATRAAAGGGVYRPSGHLAELRRDARPDPQALVDSHVRRLEALRRRGLVERLDADAWAVPADFLQRVGALDAGRGRLATLRVLSLLDLDAQVVADGATWLDRQLLAKPPIDPASALGREVHDALAARAARHIEHGEASRGPDGALTFRPGLLARLQAREQATAGARLEDEVGRPFAALGAGEAVEGVYRRRVQLVSGVFALVERSQDFVLAPWRPVIEPQLGKAVRGVAVSGGVDWRLGRERGPGL